MLALQANDPATGKVQLEKLLQSDFQDKATVHFFLGQIEEEMKNTDAALPITSRSPPASSTSRPAAGQPSFSPRKASSKRRGNWCAARSVVRPWKNQLLQAEAQLLRETKRYDEAYALLANALKANPDDPELLYDSALIAERLGKFDVLESQLKRLLKSNPTTTTASTPWAAPLPTATSACPRPSN